MPLAETGRYAIHAKAGKASTSPVKQGPSSQVSSDLGMRRPSPCLSPYLEFAKRRGRLGQRHEGPGPSQPGPGAPVRGLHREEAQLPRWALRDTTAPRQLLVVLGGAFGSFGRLGSKARGQEVILDLVYWTPPLSNGQNSGGTETVGGSCLSQGSLTQFRLPILN